jgi:hypothetical protein
MFLHLITICMGLIIAFGLQQLVELFQRRRRIRKHRALEQQAATPSNEHIEPPPPTSQP